MRNLLMPSIGSALLLMGCAGTGVTYPNLKNADVPNARGRARRSTSGSIAAGFTASTTSPAVRTAPTYRTPAAQPATERRLGAIPGYWSAPRPTCSAFSRSTSPDGKQPLEETEVPSGGCYTGAIRFGAARTAPSVFRGRSSGRQGHIRNEKRRLHAEGLLG
jgi:hypothetical protein